MNLLQRRASLITAFARCPSSFTHKTSMPKPLANESSPPESEASVPSVHPQETTTHDSPPTSYRQRLIQKHEGEYNATKKAYRQWDNEEKTFREFDLEGCRDDAWFAVHLPTATVRVLSSACRLRWCPLCSATRTGQIVQGVGNWLHTCRSPKFFTLTLRHSDESLEKQITRLYACFVEFRRRSYVGKHVRGGCWFFQVKFSLKSQQWHPHLHCVLDAEYMPQKTLKAIWREVTGDSDIVDIRAVRNKKKTAEYVARYAARPATLSTMTTEQAVEVMRALHRRRLCGKWGSGRAIKLSRPPQAALDEYFSICRWADLKSLAQNSPFAAKIRESYESGKRLNIVCTRANLLALYEEMTGKNEIDLPPPLKERQLVLFSTGPGTYSM